MQRIEPGCYIDGHWGTYAIERLHDFAASMVNGYYATRQGRDDERIIMHHLHGDDDETVTLETGEQVSRQDATDIVLGDLYEKLTDRLPTNDDDEMYWYWYDGELFYGIDPDDDGWEFSDDGMTATNVETGETARF